MIYRVSEIATVLPVLKKKNISYFIKHGYIKVFNKREPGEWKVFDQENAEKICLIAIYRTQITFSQLILLLETKYENYKFNTAIGVVLINRDQTLRDVRVLLDECKAHYSDIQRRKFIKRHGENKLPTESPSERLPQGRVQ